MSNQKISQLPIESADNSDAFLVVGLNAGNKNRTMDLGEAIDKKLPPAVFYADSQLTLEESLKHPVTRKTIFYSGPTLAWDGVSIEVYGDNYIQSPSFQMDFSNTVTFVGLVGGVNRLILQNITQITGSGTVNTAGGSNTVEFWTDRLRTSSTVVSALSWVREPIMIE